MTPPRSFRLNQYNWLGQKFLAQHRYGDILKLRECLTHLRANEIDVYIGNSGTSRPLSDHLSYLSGLARMKTGNHLEDLIFTLQRLSFQKNSQYFLLLCQSLLYLGNHDSVVALCKQVLNREISTATTTSSYEGSENEDAQDNQEKVSASESLSAPPPPTGVSEKESKESGQQLWCLEQICEESMEFKKIFDCVNGNNLVNDPRLWFIFAVSLEHQLQFKDADLAHRIACKLASGRAKQIFCRKSCDEQASVLVTSIGGDQMASSVGISNYYLPHTNYSEFCIRHRGDYKTAMQILSQVSQIAPPINYTLNPNLALTLCSQANSNSGHFTKALEIITSLDNHSNSLRNPSFMYNQLALKCRQKMHNYYNEARHADICCYDYLQRVGDERSTDLEYSLIKSHILVNSIVQSNMHNPILYKWSPTQAKQSSHATEEVKQIFVEIDKLIGTLRNSDSSCWSSHSLWNNLGVCYLIKRRYVASLSCLMKAHQLNPLDWRVNYNLSLVYLHVGTTVRALCHSFASRSLHDDHRQSPARTTAISVTIPPAPRDQIISTMLAISYSELGLAHEARRFYAEFVAQGRGDGKVPILTLINYLLLLQQPSESSTSDQNSIDNSEQDVKSSFRLLDLLEQAWLQRSPNDPQFSAVPLRVALMVGEALQQSRPQTKKNYAWTKCNQI